MVDSREQIVVNGEYDGTLFGRARRVDLDPIPEADQLELVKNPSYHAALAENPHLVVGAQHYLAENASDYVRCELTKHTNLAASTQLILARDADSSVRSQLGWRSQSLCQKAREILAEDAEYNVRRKVAELPNLTSELMDRFVADSSLYVRASIAGNPDLPRHLQVRLSFDQERLVRVGLWRNPRRTRTMHLSLQFLREFDYSTYQRAVERVDPEIVDGIAANWRQSGFALREAGALVS